jgi:hypothetical protein
VKAAALERYVGLLKGVKQRELETIRDIAVKSPEEEVQVKKPMIWRG